MTEVAGVEADFARVARIWLDGKIRQNEATFLPVGRLDLNLSRRQQLCEERVDFLGILGVLWNFEAQRDRERPLIHDRLRDEMARDHVGVERHAHVAARGGKLLYA